MGACATLDFSEAPVDQTSPAGAAVTAALAKPGDYPSFADIPPAPTDRALSAWRSEIQALNRTGDAVRREGAVSTFSLDNSEAFASEARAEARPPGVAAPTEKEQRDAAEFAKALRERATPPPLAR